MPRSLLRGSLLMQILFKKVFTSCLLARFSKRWWDGLAPHRRIVALCDGSAPDSQSHRACPASSGEVFALARNRRLRKDLPRRGRGRRRAVERQAGRRRFEPDGAGDRGRLPAQDPARIRGLDRTSFSINPRRRGSASPLWRRWPSSPIASRSGARKSNRCAAWPWTACSRRCWSAK